MDPLLVSAASGMRARMESLDLLANNLANAGTSAFKSDREFYGLYTAAEASGPAEEGIATMPDTQPVIEKHWTDHSQGVLRPTGNPLDVALDGPGFFSADGPSGTLYTRSGNFRLSAAGVLTTSDGYPVRTTDGGKIQSASNGAIEIGPNGAVRQDGQELGQLAVSAFPDQTTIDKRGLSYFFSIDPQLKPQASTAEVRQGSLEQSNVVSAESAVRLVSVMRQFESLQKAVNIGNEMNKSAEELARVTQ